MSQGSDLDPKFLHLIYRPAGEVGAAWPWWAWGYLRLGWIQPQGGAAQIDMISSTWVGAAVLGAMRGIGELAGGGGAHDRGLLRKHGDGSAVHPGDIVGRLTAPIGSTTPTPVDSLADALLSPVSRSRTPSWYTLTGACVVALGDEMAGLWSNNDGLATALQQAADAGGEGLWRMPLRASYKEGLKSKLADFKNTGPRPGGSITAALFLEHFVGEGIAWAHIDIAGTVWSDKGRGLDPAGATGKGCVVSGSASRPPDQ